MAVHFCTAHPCPLCNPPQSNINYTVAVDRVFEQRDALVKALQKIADLVDSEAGEPLDDAIQIANEALILVGQMKDR